MFIRMQKKAPIVINLTQFGNNRQDLSRNVIINQTLSLVYFRKLPLYWKADNTQSIFSHSCLQIIQAKIYTLGQIWR